MLSKGGEGPPTLYSAKLTVASLVIYSRNSTSASRVSSRPSSYNQIVVSCRSPGAQGTVHTYLGTVVPSTPVFHQRSSSF